MMKSSKLSIDFLKIDLMKKRINLILSFSDKNAFGKISYLIYGRKYLELIDFRDRGN